MIYKARYRTGSDSEYQPLETHLGEMAMFVELFGKKVGLPKPALLAGPSYDKSLSANRKEPIKEV
jgi:hypothetical protein